MTNADATTRLGNVQRLVLLAFRDAGPAGLTDDEVSALLAPRPPSTLRGRRRELADLGLLKHKGTSRPTARGLKGSVWFITPAGRNTLKRNTT